MPKYTFLLTFLFLSILSISASAQHGNDHTSEYAGQEQRAIKSLSERDIEELRAGQGWGLAKAAELNGVPGPRHVLDMADQIDLPPGQREKIQLIFDAMQKEAIKWGKELIEAEKDLNQFFVGHKTNADSLKSKVMKASHALMELRFVHLKSHLETAEVLNYEQIKKYNALRGYNSGTDPCEDVPEGHDPELWRKHNNYN